MQWTVCRNPKKCSEASSYVEFYTQRAHEDVATYIKYTDTIFDKTLKGENLLKG